LKSEISNLKFLPAGQDSVQLRNSVLLASHDDASLVVGLSPRATYLVFF
jgi:hypothetical protein